MADTENIPEQIPAQQDPPSKASKLYQSLLKEGYTKDNLGDENEFTKALADPIKADKIYSGLRSDGYTEDNLGKKDEFLSSFATPKKKDNLALPSSDGTSQLPAQSNDDYSFQKVLDTQGIKPALPKEDKPVGLRGLSDMSITERASRKNKQGFLPEVSNYAAQDNTANVAPRKTGEHIDFVQHNEEKKQAHAENVEEGIKNTAQKYLESQGVIVTDDDKKGTPAKSFVQGKALGEKEVVSKNSALFNQTVEKYREAYQNGDATFAIGKDGTLGLKRTIGGMEGLSKGWNEATQGEEDAQNFVHNMDDYDRVQFIEQQPVNEHPEYLGDRGTSLGSALEFGAAQAPFLSKAAAGAVAGTAIAALAPETGGISLAALPKALSFLATAHDMSNQGAMAETMRRYAILRHDDPTGDKVAQMKKATEGGMVGSLAGIATNALLMGEGGAAATNILKQGISNDAKSVIKNAIKNVYKSSVHMGNVGAGIEGAKQLIGAVQGVHTVPSDVASDMAGAWADNAKTGAILTGVMAGVGVVPKVLKSAFKYALKDVNPKALENTLKFNEDNGKIPEGSTEKVMGEMDKYKEALAQTPKGLSPEAQASMAGLIEKQNSLIEEQKTKHTSAKADYDIQINALEEQINKIKETGKPFSAEIDEMSGEKYTQRNNNGVEVTPPQSFPEPITINGNEKSTIEIVKENAADVKSPIYKNVLENGSDADIHDVLKEVSDQWHDEGSRENTVKTFGQPIVDEAIKMFPQEESKSLSTDAIGQSEPTSTTPILKDLEKIPFEDRTNKQHSEYIKQKFVKEFSDKGVPKEQLDAAVALMDARAIASGEGDAWFRKIEDIGNGEFKEGSKRLNQVEAYHGSPHDFDEFSTSKMGSGEGAQSFGWGLYFTDAESIAKQYALGKYKTQNENLPLFADRAIWETRSKDKNTILEKLNEYSKDERLNGAAIQKAIDYIKSMPSKEIEALKSPSKESSVLYEASLHKGKTPEQYDWLNWDKAVTENQLSKIKEQITKENDIERPFYAKKALEAKSGEALYDDLKLAFGKDKEASLFLLRAGVDGIKYPTESLSKGTIAGEKGSNYVVFDEKAVSINNKIKFQDAKGALETLANGRKIVHALDAPDFSTAVHEIAHIFEDEISEKQRQVIQDWAGTKEWDTKTSETWARGFERYLRDGNAPTEELKSVFQKAKEWLQTIYQKLKGSAISKNITPEVKSVFDKLFKNEETSNNIPKPEAQASVTDETANSNQPEAGEAEIGGEKTGVKRSVTDEVRTQLNLPKVELPKMATDAENLHAAKERVDNGNSNPREMVNRILKGDEGYKNENDVFDMQYYAHQLQAKEIELRQQRVNASTPEEQAEIGGKLGQLSDEVDRQTQAAQLAGNKWHKVGMAMQPVIDTGFNITREKAFVKDAYGGDIPKDVSMKIDAITKERDDALAQRDKVEELLKQKLAKDAVDKIAKDAKKITTRDAKKEELKKEEQSLIEELKKAFRKDLGQMNSGIPIPKATIEALGKLAVNYFKQGALTVDAIAEKIYESVKGHIDDRITKKDIRDLIAQYEPLSIERENDRLNKKADKIEGDVTPMSVKTKNGKLAGVPEPIDFNKPTKIQLAFRNNTEWVKANQRVVNAEHAMNQLKRKAFESEKNWYQYGLMWVGRITRLSVLSGYNVLNKLASAAVIGGAVKRIPEEAFGLMWQNVYKGIAQKAPIEGAWYAKSQIKFYKEFFNPKKFVKNAWEILRTGSSQLTKRLGEDTHEHIPILYIPTDLHQIIKDPVKRGVFEVAFRNGMIWSDKNGLDINDVLVVQSIENAAYKRANYEIFQESNWLSRKFTSYKSSLETKGLAGSKNAGATAKLLVDFMIPVSTVPTNIVRRVLTTSPLGLIRGNIQAMSAYRSGIETLSNEQADKVMRQLKQGTLGTALWLIGWYGYSSYGGLYSNFNPNKKRQEGDLASDEMEVGGVMLPKPVQHAIPLEIIQTAATARRVYENYRSKDKSTPEALYNAGLSSIGALAEQVPVIETPVHAVEAMGSPYEAEKFKEDMGRRLVPQILKETGIIADSRVKPTAGLSQESLDFIKSKRLDIAKPQDKYVKDGVDKKMSDDDYKKYLQRRNERVEDALNQIKSKGLTNGKADDKSVKEAVKQAVSDANEMAKFELFGEQNKKPTTPVFIKNYKPLPLQKQ